MFRLAVGEMAGPHIEHHASPIIVGSVRITVLQRSYKPIPPLGCLRHKLQF